MSAREGEAFGARFTKLLHTLVTKYFGYWEQRTYTTGLRKCRLNIDIVEGPDNKQEEVCSFNYVDISIVSILSIAWILTIAVRTHVAHLADPPVLTSSQESRHRSSRKRSIISSAGVTRGSIISICWGNAETSPTRRMLLCNGSQLFCQEPPNCSMGLRSPLGAKLGSPDVDRQSGYAIL